MSNFCFWFFSSKSTKKTTNFKMPSARFSYGKVSVNRHLKSVSGSSVCNFRFWIFSPKRTKKTTTKCHSFKRNLSSNPPKKSVHWNEKIGEIIFKSFFGEATKLQEILCHQENAKQRKKILLLLYLLSIITNTYTNDVEIFHLFFILTVMLNMTKK